MKFLPLFSLHILHDYYGDNRCPDFQLVATPGTQRLIKNYQGVIRTWPHGIQIIIPVTDAKQPFIMLQSGVKFNFHLRLQNPDFTLFTDLAEFEGITNPVFTNRESGNGAASSLTLISRQNRVTEQFAVNTPRSTEQFTLSGRPSTGLKSTDFSIEGLGSVAAPTHYAEEVKIITVDTSVAHKGDHFRVTYVAIPQKLNGVFAEVEIHYHDSWPDVADGPASFQIVFKAKAARWKYYVVADADAEFQIRDQGDVPIRFDSANRTDLTQNPDETDSVASMLADQYPAMQRLRFVSDGQVTCRQKPRTSLQLLLDGKKVLEPLPNPSFQHLSTFDFVKNSVQHKEDALYQVVKYFKH